MLASVRKIPMSLVMMCTALALAACKTDNVATATPANAVTPAPRVALTRPEAQLGLIGHDSAAVIAAYGKPVFVRKESDSELWRYDGVHCAAFFFLYQDQGVLRVRYVETLPQGSLTTVDESCLVGIKANAAATS
jgi:hypothetical protein